jgi:glycosyltransferase involved in cell wall biosynthesis
VLTLTEGARRDLGANFGVPEKRLVRMSANAVLEKAVADRASAQRERGLLVSVGRLSPEKDYPTLIRAFAKLDREDLRLEIAGEGPMREALQSLINELGVSDRVALLGFVADPFSVFSRAVLAVSSSRYEGFGNAIVEALACGTPVVATDCPYGPREILAGGGCGILVPVGDADALAQGITQTLATRYDRAELRARASAHTAARAVDALLAVIRGLDGRANPSNF